MTTHVQTWIASARLTDMTNSGRRGKTCHVLHFRGVEFGQTPQANWTLKILSRLQRMHPDYADQFPLPSRAPLFLLDCPFDEAAGLVRSLVAEAQAAGVDSKWLQLYDETIRGVDAPVQLLTAGVPGMWAAAADEDGVVIDNLANQLNCPRMITAHRQSKSRAYQLAAKAWAKVADAKTFHDAGDILRAAGCQLHYYCAMD